MLFSTIVPAPFGTRTIQQSVDGLEHRILITFGGITTPVFSWCAAGERCAIKATSRYNLSTSPREVQPVPQKSDNKINELFRYQSYQVYDSGVSWPRMVPMEPVMKFLPLVVVTSLSFRLRRHGLRLLFVFRTWQSRRIDPRISTPPGVGRREPRVSVGAVPCGRFADSPHNRMVLLAPASTRRLGAKRTARSSPLPTRSADR